MKWAAKPSSSDLILIVRQYAPNSIVEDSQMNPIDAKVQAARRRLMLGQFGRSFAILLFLAMVVATTAIAVPAFRSMNMDHTFWNQAWIIGGAMVALIASIAYTFWKAPPVSWVAAEVDRRFGLRERLSSSIELGEQDRHSAFGIALQEDAAKRAEQLAIGDHFPLQPRKIGWLPLTILPLLAILIALVQPLSSTDVDPAIKNDSIEVKQIKRVAQKLKRRIQQQKRKAEAEGLKESRELFEKMESQLDKLTNKKGMNRKDAMIALNDLKKQLEDRKKQLGSSEKMRKVLSNMNGVQSGPADKIAKAIQKGEFGKAEDLVKQLAKKIREGNLSKTEKKQLQKQIEKMGKALKQAAKEHDRKKQELKEKIEKAKQEGRGADAAKMQQQLNKMQQQDSQLQKAGQMAQAMQQAADAMKSGDSKAAADAMQQMADQLGEMSQEMSELEDLESAMGELSQSKNQMRCKDCQGDGCQGCQGGGFGLNDKPGDGLGKGNGKGDRPESEGDTNTYETQVRGKVKKGKAIIAGFADGPNRKGVTREDIKAAIQSQISEESDPTENQSLPRTEREHTQQYFDRLREGT